MRFQQLKRDPNAVMRKKLYKSGKNWIVMSTLTFVGGLAMLGMGTTSVQADTVDSSTVNQDNTEVVQGSNANSSGTKTETTAITDGASQVDTQSLNEDKQNTENNNTENEQTNTSANTTVDEQQKQNNINVEQEQNVPVSGVDTGNEAKNVQAAQTRTVTPQVEIEPVEADNTNVADSTTTSDTSTDTQPSSDNSTFTIPSNIAEDHQGKFFIDDGTGTDLGTGSKWYLDTDGTLYIGPGVVADPKLSADDGPQWSHYKYASDITKAVFEKGTVAGTSLQSYFYMLENLESVDINNLDVSRTIEFESMFDGTTNLKSLDLSAWKNIQAGSDFQYMFSNSGVTNVNISGFNLNDSTTKEANINAMFRQDYNLTNVELPNKTAQTVSLAGWVFQGDNALESLDLSNFYFVQDNDSQMLDGANNLKELKLNSDMVLDSVMLSQTFTMVKNENGEDKVYHVSNFNGWTDGNNKISNDELNKIYSAGSTDTRKEGIVTWTAIDGRVPYEIHFIDADTGNPIQVQVGGKVQDYVISGEGPSGSPIPLDVNLPGYATTGDPVPGSVTTLAQQVPGKDAVEQTLNVTVAEINPQALIITEKDSNGTDISNQNQALIYNDKKNNDVKVSKIVLDTGRKLDFSKTSYSMQSAGNDLIDGKLNDNTVNKEIGVSPAGFINSTASDQGITFDENSTASDLINILANWMENLGSTQVDTVKINLVYLPVNYTINYVLDGGNGTITSTFTGEGSVKEIVRVPTISELVKDGKLKTNIPGYAADSIETPTITLPDKDSSVYTVKVPTLNSAYIQVNQLDPDGKSLGTQKITVPIYGTSADTYDLSGLISDLPIDTKKSAIIDPDGTKENWQADSNIQDTVNNKIDALISSFKTNGDKSADTGYTLNLYYDYSPITVNFTENDGDKVTSNTTTFPYESNLNNYTWVSSLPNRNVDWSRSSYELNDESHPLTGVTDAESFSSFVKNTVGSASNNSQDAGQTYSFNIIYKDQVGYTVNYLGVDGKTTLYTSDKQVGDVGDPVKIDTLANLKHITPGYAATSVGVASKIVSGQDTYDVKVPTVDDYYKLTINARDANGNNISTSISIPRYGSADDTTVQNAVADLSSEHIDLSNLKLNNETISNPVSLDSYIKDLINKENIASTDLAKNASAITDTQPTVSQTLDVGYKEQVTYKVNYLGADGKTVLYTTSNTGYVGDPVVVDTLANLKQVKPGYAANKIGDAGTITSGKTYDVSVPTTNDYYDLTINGRDANNKATSATISVPKYGSADDASVKDAIAKLSGTDIDWANTKLGDATVTSADDLTSYINSLISEQNQASSKLSYDSDDLPTTDQTLNLAYLAPKVNYTINYVSSNDPTKALYSETNQSGRVGDKVDVPTISQLVQNGTLKNKIAGYSADSPASITLTSDNNYDVKVPTVADYLTLNISQTDSDKKPLATVAANVPMYGQASTDVTGLSGKKVDWNNSKVSGNFKLNDGTSVDGMILSNLASKLGLSTDSASLSDLVKAVLTEANTTSDSFAKDSTTDDTKVGNTLNLDVVYKADESNNSGSNTGSNADNSDNNNDDSDIGTIVKKPQDIATTGQVVTLYNKDGDVTRIRALGANTAWYSDEIYTFKGEKYYRVATGEFAKLNQVYKYESIKQNIKTSRTIPVYNERGVKLNMTLPANTSYTADMIVTINGVSYYRIADDEFVKKSDVLPN